MCWIPRVYKTQEEKDEQRKTTPQYVLDTKGIQDTGERQPKENHTTICVGHQRYTRHRRKTNKEKPHHNICWTPRVYKTQEKAVGVPPKTSSGFLIIFVSAFEDISLKTNP